MARYRHTGTVHTFEREPDPENPWPGIIFVLVIVFFAVASCSG